MPDFARNTRSDESVKKVQGEKKWQHENQNLFAQDDDAANEKDGNEGFGEGSRGLQIERLKCGILHLTHHHGREEKHQDRQGPFPISLRKFLFVPPHHKERQRCDEAGRGWNWKSKELLTPASS